MHAMFTLHQSSVELLSYQQTDDYHCSGNSNRIGFSFVWLGSSLSSLHHDRSWRNGGQFKVVSNRLDPVDVRTDSSENGWSSDYTTTITERDDSNSAPWSIGFLEIHRTTIVTLNLLIELKLIGLNQQFEFKLIKYYRTTGADAASSTHEFIIQFYLFGQRWLALAIANDLWNNFAKFIRLTFSILTFKRNQHIKLLRIESWKMIINQMKSLCTGWNFDFPSDQCDGIADMIWLSWNREANWAYVIFEIEICKAKLLISSKFMLE